MGDNNLEEVISLQRMLADLSDSEKQQAKEDLAVLQGKTKNVVFKVHVTAKSLRKAANKLDEVWKDCKIAHAFGTTAGIVGGVLTIGGGIATIMTLGAAAPLLLVGMGVGAAGAGTNLGTSIVEAAINSNEIKKAEADLKETLECINEVNTTIKLWLDRKEESRLLYIFCLAMQTLELSEPVIKLLQQVILNITSIPAIIVEAATRVFLDVGKAGVKAGGKAGARAAGKAGAKAAGKAGAKAAGKAGAKAAGKAGAKAAGKAGAKAAGKAGTKAAGQASAKAAGQTGVQVAGQAGIQVAGQTGVHVSVQAAGQTGVQVSVQAAGQTGVQAAGQISVQAAGQTGVQVSVQAAGQTGVQAAGQTGVQAAAQAGVETVGQAGAQTAGRVGAQAAGDVAESGAKAGAKAGSKLAGGLIIGVSAAFLVWDAIDLGFTIRDLVQDKGSEAASALREKADELEKQF